MNTQDAIAILEDLKKKISSDNTTFQETIDQNNNKINSIDVAVKQLQGILDTNVDLTGANNTIADLQSKVDALTTDIQGKDSVITDLQAQVAQLQDDLDKPTPVEIAPTIEPMAEQIK